MFTGIVEDMGEVLSIADQQSNKVFRISCSFVQELKIDQSVAHNGVCLTIVKLDNDWYEVEAIQETLEKSNLGELTKGQSINLERCLKVGDRLDGHMVQGHVDTTTSCTDVVLVDGSWQYTFRLPEEGKNLIVSKGSVTINGVSLTVVDPNEETFSVCIIPYTYEHTNFKQLKKGHTVNIEYDILGKYIHQMLMRSNKI